MSLLKHATLAALLSGGLIGTADATTTSYASYTFNGDSLNIYDAGLPSPGYITGGAGAITLNGVTGLPPPYSSPTTLTDVFCVDIFDFLQQPGTMNVVPPSTSLTATQTTEITNLVAYYDGLGAGQTTDVGEAIQMAIWTDEYGSAVSFTGQTTAAQADYDTYTSAAFTYVAGPGTTLNELAPAGGVSNQNLVWDSPGPLNVPNVPEPASLLVMASGLLFAGVYGFRRSRSSDR